MNADVLLNCVLIVLARVCDVSLGTVRTVQVLQGRRGLAWVLGFFEVLLWILVVSRVVNQLSQQFNIYYAVAYALGFATGNYIGITIEQRLAMGYQVVRVFTRRGEEVAGALRDQGLKVTQFEGRGRDGPVSLLYIEVPRRLSQAIAKRVRALDPKCYYVIEDIRVASASPSSVEMQEPGGFSSVGKRK